MSTYPDDFQARTTYPQHDPAYIDPNTLEGDNCAAVREGCYDSTAGAFALVSEHRNEETEEGTVDFWALMRDTDAKGSFDHIKVLFIIALLVFAPYLVSWMVAAR